MEDYILLSGNSNPELAKSIAQYLNKKLCDVEVGRFSDGEITVKINEPVRGKDVYIIQSTCSPANDNLMELLIIMDALRRASAKSMNVIIPYYGYARQDRKDVSRVPITSKLVADMIATAGATRILTIDIHADQIMGFFSIPADRLHAELLFESYIKDGNHFDLANTVVVSPDVGSVKRSRALSEGIGCPLAIVDKRRPKDNVSEVMNVIGDVKEKHVIMIDDMVDTAGTICGAAKALKGMGALSIHVFATHGVLSGPAIDRLKVSDIDKLIITDTIPLTEEKKIDKIEVLSIAQMIAKAIDVIANNKSMSALFEGDK